MLNFLQPWMLWGLLAVAVPILIHLINKWRHKSVAWAAMSFLIRANKELKGVKKLRHYMILAARVLAIAALAIALSRPQVSSWLGFGGSVVDNIIVILDRSASMEIRHEGEKKSAREISLERLMNTMKEMGSARFYIIESAGTQVVDVSSPEVLTTLSESTGTDSAADIPLLMEKAVAYIQENLSGTSEIWITSDMQQSNWFPDSGRWELVRSGLAALTGNVNVRIMEMKNENSQNSSIRVTNARIKDGELYLTMEVHRHTLHSDTEQTLPITISVNEGRISESVRIQGNYVVAEKRIALPNKVTSGYGYVSLPHDSNERDNVSYFTFEEDTPAKVVAVGAPGEARDVTLSMAAPDALNTRIAEKKSIEALVKSGTYDASLLIWSGSLPTGQGEEYIKEYLKRGGFVFFIPSSSLDVTPGEFMGLKWGSREESPEDKLFLMSEWDREQGPLRDGTDGRSIPVDHVRAIMRAPIIGEGMVLAAWDDESPAIMRKTVDNGQFFMMGTLPEYEWSNLGDGYVLLPLLQRLADEGVSRFSMPNAHEIGAWQLPVQPGQAPVRVDGYQEDKRSFSPFTAGVYRLDDIYYALNRPEREDEPEVIPAETLRDLFTGIKLTSISGSLRDTDSLVSEVWRTFYMFVILFLLLEAFLSLPRREILKKDF